MRAVAPGRVNLIGDHTDYTGGRVLPIAIDRCTTVTGSRTGTRVDLRSTAADGRASIDVGERDPAMVQPAWARHVAGVIAELQPTTGFAGTIETTLRLASGLSSSASLSVATALALGAPVDDPLGLALVCQRAEQRATGVPCGVMDQLAIAAGVQGHALLIDCGALTVEPIPVPPNTAVLVVHSGEARELAASAYGHRRDDCERAERVVGPLRVASMADVDRVPDATLRRRARHVVSENARVSAMAESLRAGDVRAAGALMVASHASLRDDYEVSTPALDALVEHLVALPGVYGARLTGAGFGGCVVALADDDADLDAVGGWRVEASTGARLEVLEPTP